MTNEELARLLTEAADWIGEYGAGIAASPSLQRKADDLAARLEYAAQPMRGPCPRCGNESGTVHTCYVKPKLACTCNAFGCKTAVESYGDLCDDHSHYPYCPHCNGSYEPGHMVTVDSFFRPVTLCRPCAGQGPAL